MRIVVNGKSRQVDDPTTLLDLIAHLGLSVDRCAVELNRQLVKRPAWAETKLQSNDQVEIVQFVGGG